jgi:hypothetical protein
MNCLSEQEITPPLTVRRVQGFKKRWPRYLLMPTARDRSGAPIARLHSARVRVTTPPPCSGRPPRGARKVLNEAGACVARERAAIPTPIIDLIAIFAFSLRQEGFRCF